MADQRIVIYGAGAAGLGICRQIRAGLELEGLTAEEAARRVAVLDSRGLLVDDRDLRDDYKKEMAWQSAWAAATGLADAAARDLRAVVDAFRPTVLIGASGQPGAFGEDIVRAMAEFSERPVVLPFSNPTDITEAVPADVIRWTDGMGLVATGSPFDAVVHDGEVIEVGQGNNVFIFPGIGLGALLCEAARVSDGMITASAQALAGAVTHDELERGLLFPSIKRLREVSAAVAAAVMRRAADEGIGNGDLNRVEERVEKAMWLPRYADYVAVD